jgi:C4-dicarboxylate transporter, DctM subunit
VNTSVADLFLAGILPGIVLMVIFMAYIAVRVLLQPELVPPEAERFNWGERLRASLGVLPVALLILTIIGGLYTGVMTPTEAAAVAALLALVLGALLGQLRWRGLLTSVAKTVQATCMVIFILVGAQVLSFAMTNNGINREVSQAVVGLHLPPAGFYLAIVLLYTLLGMFVDGLSMLLLTLPVLYPIVQQMGFDPIWFGIVLVIMIEMGQVTPPVGLNLFVIHGMAGGRPLSDVVRGALPYGALMYILLALLWFWPTLALALVHRPT